MQLIDRPLRQSIVQSGLVDGKQIIGAVAPVDQSPAAISEKPKKPRAPRKPKAEAAPVPPAAPPAPAPEKPKKAKAVAAPAAPGPETSPVQKSKFVKGSDEAKAHMAKLREAAKAKKAAIAAASKTPEGGSEVDDVAVTKKAKVVKKAKVEAVA